MKQNVTVIHHTPAWLDHISNRNYSDQPLLLERSHLYANPSLMIGAFLRIDIPMLPILSAYNFIFYTDVDVVFLQPVFVSDLPIASTSTVSMARELTEKPPCNSGVQLYKTTPMRQQHAAFVDLIFSNERLSFQGGVQLVNGAFNHFYGESMHDQCLLDGALNTILLTPPQPEGAKVLHIVGPKLQLYATYATTDNCTFPVTIERQGYLNICDIGARHLCVYLARVMSTIVVWLLGGLVIVENSYVICVYETQGDYLAELTWLDTVVSFCEKRALVGV